MHVEHAADTKKRGKYKQLACLFENFFKHPRKANEPKEQEQTSDDTDPHRCHETPLGDLPQ